MIPPATIRRFVVDDAAALAAILVPAIRAGEVFALARDMTAADAIAYWCGPSHEAFVAEAGGRIVGGYYLRANQAGGGDHVANAGYVVDPAAAGRGVARAMVAHSLHRARARGFAAMQFNFVVSTNARAVSLWRSLGFAVVGRLPDAFRHPALGPVDAFVMFRSLTD